MPLFSPLKTNLLRAKGEVGPGSPKRMLGSGALRATPPPQAPRKQVACESRGQEGGEEGGPGDKVRKKRLSS